MKSSVVPQRPLQLRDRWWWWWWGSQLWLQIVCKPAWQSWWQHSTSRFRAQVTVNQSRGPVNFWGFVLALGQRHQSLRVVLNTNTANADHTHTQVHTGGYFSSCATCSNGEKAIQYENRSMQFSRMKCVHYLPQKTFQKHAVDKSMNLLQWGTYRCLQMLLSATNANKRNKFSVNLPSKEENIRLIYQTLLWPWWVPD